MQQQTIRHRRTKWDELNETNQYSIVVVIEPTEHFLQELLKLLNTLLDSHIVFRRMNRDL